MVRGREGGREGGRERGREEIHFGAHPLSLPPSFPQSLTEYTGEPLPLQEQKDVDEFATLLFDKLESLDPRIDRLLKSLLYGVLVRK